MLITEEIEITWHAKTRKRYESLGYQFTKYKDKFIVKIEDLSKGSDFVVQYTCDYCGTELNNKYDVYNKRRKKIEKDCCKECITLKVVESNLELKGYKSYLSSNEGKTKIAQTNLERYGVENVFELKEFQDKATESIKNKYGVENVFQSDEIKDKIKKTNLNKYGVEYPQQNREIRRLSMKNRVKNNQGYKPNGDIGFYNGVPASKMQIAIANQLGGKINFPILDVGYTDILIGNDICIEYDGGGHNLSVKIGKISQDEFDRKENKRNFKLIENGYKVLRIVNTKDLKFDTKIISDWLSDNNFRDSNLESIIIS